MSFASRSRPRPFRLTSSWFWLTIRTSCPRCRHRDRNVNYKSQSAEPQDDDRGMIKSLQKALALLEEVAMAERPPRIAEVALAVGISRPTAYRIVQTLIAEGYLFQDPNSARLFIGYSVLRQSA